MKIDPTSSPRALLYFSVHIAQSYPAKFLILILLILLRPGSRIEKPKISLWSATCTNIGHPLVKFHMLVDIVKVQNYSAH